MQSKPKQKEEQWLLRHCINSFCFQFGFIIRYLNIYFLVESVIKIILAVLFFICVLNMPYGFYQFVRLAGFIGFTILAYQANQQGIPTEMFIYGGLALLFQPFFKIALGREIWNIVDVLVGLGLIASLFWKSQNSRSK